MLSWIALALCSLSLVLLLARDVRFGMNLRRRGRIEPAGGFLVLLGYRLQEPEARTKPTP